MAANIDMSRGAASYARGKLPWHQLGIWSKEAKSAEEVLKLSNLDFEVKKAPNKIVYPPEMAAKLNISEAIVPNTYSVYRDDTGGILTQDGKSVTSQYNLYQNIEAFEFLDTIVSQGYGTFETAGALGKGEQIFVSVKINNSFKFGNDDVDQYLLISTKHDGTGSVVIKYTPIRVVCNNTLSYALGVGEDLFRIKHSSIMHQQIDVARNLIDFTYNAKDLMNEALDVYLSKSLNNKEVDMTLATIASTKELPSNILSIDDFYRSDDVSTKVKNTYMDYKHYYDVGIGQDDIKNTAYGVLNAITGYYQNSKQYKNDEAKFVNIDTGTARNKLTKAKIFIDNLI